MRQAWRDWWREWRQGRLLKTLKRCDPAWRSAALEPGNGFGASGLLQVRNEARGSNLASGPLDGVQLLTRFCAIEQPYWLGFLQHYQRLGVRTVHVCVQHAEDQRLLKRFAVPDGVRLHSHLISGAQGPEALLSGFRLERLNGTEPFTLLVDVDERLERLNPSFSIERLAALHPQMGQFICPWLMAPQLQPQSEVTAGFWGHVGKPLARSARIAAVDSDHAFRMERRRHPPGYGSLPVGSYGLVIVHFWARSLRDCLLKTLLSRFRDAKSCDQGEALALIRAGELPVRLRLLAYLDCQQRYLAVPDPLPALVDHELEERLLRACLTVAEEQLCCDIFWRYRERLLCHLHELPPYPAITLLKLAPLLPTAQNLLA